jgi:hypothetical protein
LERPTPWLVAGRSTSVWKEFAGEAAVESEDVIFQQFEGVEGYWVVTSERANERGAERMAHLYTASWCLWAPITTPGCNMFLPLLG